jgi:hypothetical protein
VLAEEVNAAHRAARVASEVHFAEARRAGELLIEAKGRVGHGRWSKWLGQNFDGSARTARAYMQLAREQEPRNGSAADLSIRAALAQAKQRREQLRREAGAKPTGHVRAAYGVYRNLPVREASDKIRADRGLPPLPPMRCERARTELDKARHPAAGTDVEVVVFAADGDGGRSRQVVREDDCADLASAIAAALDQARKGQPC